MNVFKDQIWHFFFLVLLLLGLCYLIEIDPSLLAGRLWSIDSSVWLLLAVLSPIIHQLYVMACWRIELYTHAITKRFGKKGFEMYKAGFALLILSRLVTIVLLAFSNRDTLPVSDALSWGLSLLFLIPVIYLFYSVARYFGMDRAFGIDHFYPEKIMDEPFVKKGIFRFTSNGMYIYGFLLLYIPGLLLHSKAAIALALFNHLYIWVHYYFTERPDMKVIYGKKNTA